jgi:hypothetical protein
MDENCNFTEKSHQRAYYHVTDISRHKACTTERAQLNTRHLHKHSGMTHVSLSPQNFQGHTKEMQ